MIHAVLHLLLQPGPEISAEAVGRGCGSFPSSVSLVEILLDHLQEGQRDLAPRRLCRDDAERVSLVDEEGEGVAVAGVGEAVVAGEGEPLQALHRDVPEVALVRRLLRHHRRPTRHHRVYQLLLLPMPRHRSRSVGIRATKTTRKEGNKVWWCILCRR